MPSLCTPSSVGRDGYDCRNFVAEGCDALIGGLSFSYSSDGFERMFVGEPPSRGREEPGDDADVALGEFGIEPPPCRR